MKYEISIGDAQCCHQKSPILPKRGLLILAARRQANDALTEAMHALNAELESRSQVSQTFALILKHFFRVKSFCQSLTSRGASVRILD